MISGKIAERRWLKEPTQLQWRVILPSAKTALLSPIEKANYLSLKRKKPTDETTILNTAKMPSQLVFVYSKVGFQSAYIFFASCHTENDSPCKRFNGFSVQNSLKKKFLLNSKPSPYTLKKMSTNEPVATITNIFCLLFIEKFKQ
jgi:hypothetical protein